MKTIMKFRIKSVLHLLSVVIFVAVTATPIEAQVKGDKRTKTKKKSTEIVSPIDAYKIKINKNKNEAPKNDVAKDDSRDNFLVTNPRRSTQTDLIKWRRTVDKMQGIEAFDPVRNFIDSYPAQKTGGSDKGALSWVNNWVPIDSEKHACCGKLRKFKIYQGGTAEMDWGFYIEPNDYYSFLVEDVLKHKDPEWTDIAWDGPGSWHINDYTGGYYLEGEITPDESLFQNVFFPRRGKEEKHSWGDISITPNLGMIGKNICIYGPWVREVVHNNRPEIHPSEMIWWREKKGYYLMLIQDGSERFDNKDEGKFDFGFAGGTAPSDWKAWAEPPLTAQFKIAFEANPSTSKLPLKMDIRETYNKFVVTKDDANASKDSDNGTSHTLVVDNKKLLIVNEQQENDNDLGVKFVEITKRGDGTIQGYLQITTKVGGPHLSGEQGYHIIYVASSSIPVGRTVRDHRTKN